MLIRNENIFIAIKLKIIYNIYLYLVVYYFQYISIMTDINQTKKTVCMEIDEWNKKNNNNNFETRICDDNKFVISFKCDVEYLIEITYPKYYPKNKVGFMCKQLLLDDIKPISFIERANKQFYGKVLSISRVIEYLVNALKKYQVIKKKNYRVELMMEISKTLRDPIKYYLLRSVKFMDIYNMTIDEAKRQNNTEYIDDNILQFAIQLVKYPEKYIPKLKRQVPKSIQSIQILSKIIRDSGKCPNLRHVDFIKISRIIIDKARKLTNSRDITDNVIYTAIDIAKNPEEFIPKFEREKLKAEVTKIQKKLCLDSDMLISINSDKMDTAKIKPKKDIDVITTTQIYTPKRTGYVLLVAVGGGGGGASGGLYGSGSTGDIKVFMLYLPKISSFIIKIGRGGKGGIGGKYIQHPTSTFDYNEMCNSYSGSFNFDFESYHKINNGDLLIPKSLLMPPNNGEPTEICINGISFFAKNGTAPYKIENFQIKNNIFEYNDNITTIETLSKIYPNITLGKNGRDISCIGGLVFLDEKSSNITNNVSGFGAGGNDGTYEYNPGRYTYPSIPETYNCSDGSDGTDGCVIICYVDYDT